VSVLISFSILIQLHCLKSVLLLVSPNWLPLGTT
jgi:hypothetical protein